MGQLNRIVISTVPEDQGKDQGADHWATESPTKEVPTSWYADDPGTSAASAPGGRVRACWSMCKHIVITAFSCAIAALLSG